MLNAILIVLLVFVIGLAVYRVIQRSKKGSACCGEHEETAKRIAAPDRNKSHYPYKLTLDIGGMTCENCAIRVENALNSLPGTWAKVNIAEKRASVLLKDVPDEHRLRQAVTSAGYVVIGIIQ